MDDADRATSDPVATTPYQGGTPPSVKSPACATRPSPECSPGERTRVEAGTEGERGADGTHHGRLTIKVRRLANAEYGLDPSTVHTEQIAKTILPQLRCRPRELVVRGR